MDYLAIARSILKDLPDTHIDGPPVQPRHRSYQSDDDRIAQIAWTRMKLQMTVERSSLKSYLLLV